MTRLLQEEVDMLSITAKAYKEIFFLWSSVRPSVLPDLFSRRSLKRARNEAIASAVNCPSKISLDSKTHTQYSQKKIFNLATQICVAHIHTFRHLIFH